MPGPNFLRMCWVLVPLLSVANQACMKLLAHQLEGDPSILDALQSPYLLGILVFEIGSLLLWLRVLSVMDVGRAVPLTAVAYVFVLALGWFGFGESIQLAQIIGSALILAGVWLLSAPAQPTKAMP